MCEISDCTYKGKNIVRVNNDLLSLLVPTVAVNNIVARCDGKTTIAEIAVALAAEYESSAAELENDIAECLGDLLRKKLVVFAP